MTQVQGRDLVNTARIIHPTGDATTRFPLICGGSPKAVLTSLSMRMCTIGTIVLLFGNAADAGEDLLIRAVVNGKPTSLYEKVVVTSGKASLSKEPGGSGEPIEPFAIFFKLKTDTGQKEQNGYVRVGSSVGRPLGWIRKQDVTEWNTRFILEPTQPVPGKAFSVDLGGATAELKIVPEGKRRFALVTASTEAKDSSEESTYQVVVYAGSVQTAGTGGTLAKERNQVRDLKLEIVFVLESTDFMLNKFDDVTLGDTVKDVVRQSIAAIQKNDSLKGAVRIGIVEYQDMTSRAKFASRLTCPLSDDPNYILSSIERLSPIALNDDWPDDAIAGLSTAVSDAGWSENSSKHIILLGAASFQLDPKGRLPNQFGGSYNLLTKNPEDSGGSSTGISIRQLVARANPQAGSVEQKARASKLFHSVLVGKELPTLEPKVKDIVDKIVTSNDGVLSALLDSGKIDVETIKMMFQYYLNSYQRERAKSHHAELAHNDGVDGLKLNVEPTSADIRRASDEISRTLIKSFSTLAGVRSGDIGVAQLESSGTTNAISQTFYAIVGAAADKFKDLPIVAGKASTRDERGREVALRKVLVAQHELQRLRSTLDAIHKKFQARVAKVDRQDVTQILDDLKQLAAQTTAGQRQFAADVQLKDVITDLPLRTTALETTPRDLAVMPSDAFKQWLNKLEAAIFRADDLLNGKAEWLELSSLAENEKFTFLQVSELP